MYQFACDFRGAASPKRLLSEVKMLQEMAFLTKTLSGSLDSLMLFI